MEDIAHKDTDKLLNQLEKKLGQVYKEAYRSAKKRADDFMADYAELDEKKRKELVELEKKLSSGSLTDEEYQKLKKEYKAKVTDYPRWRRTQMLAGKRYEDMAETLANDVTNTNQIAAEIINERLPDVYAINGNYAAYQVENVSRINTGFTLYDREAIEYIIAENPDLLPMRAVVNIPKDLRWNKQKIASAIAQGILVGEDIYKIADRLASVTDMNYVSAIRNARTMVTSAENGARINEYKRAEKTGIKMQNQWIATLDGRTRHSHRQLDGEKVKVGKKFSNGCCFPGDPQGKPSEIYNCRCSLVVAFEGIDDSDAERNSKLGAMTYDEWKQSKPKYKKQR